MARKVSLDVVIAGGGVIGAACAWAAARAGLKITVYEPGPDPAAASPASAGMLAAQIEPGDPPTAALAVRARDLYAALAPTLQDSTGIDIGFWRPGILSVAFDDRAAAMLHETVAAQRRAGLRADWLDGQDVLERWPGVAPGCLGALYAPEDGAVDPQALTRALLAEARRLGASVVPEPVQTVTVAGGRVRGVVVPGGAVSADHVVVAAGAWSPLVSGLPRPLPVEPVRGQLALTAWPPAVPPVIVYHEHGYVLARGAKAILGSTMERAGFECRTTNEGLAQVFRSAVRLVPTVATLAVERMWAGLRPGSADGAPIVGPDPEVRGLWYATGHGRNGVLLAALTGEVIADLMSGGATAVDVTQWSVDRFA